MSNIITKPHKTPSQDDLRITLTVKNLMDIFCQALLCFASCEA